MSIIRYAVSAFKNEREITKLSPQATDEMCFARVRSWINYLFEGRNRYEENNCRNGRHRAVGHVRRERPGPTAAGI